MPAQPQRFLTLVQDETGEREPMLDELELETDISHLLNELLEAYNALPHHPSFPQATLQAAQRIRDLPTRFMAIEALKSACLQVLIGPHEQPAFDLLELPNAHPVDQDAASLARQAPQAILAVGGEFVVVGVSSGVVADTLNVLMQTDAFGRLVAQRQAQELDATAQVLPGSLSQGPRL